MNHLLTAAKSIPLINAIESDMAPFGFIDNGLDEPDGRNSSFFDDAGELWQPVSYRKGE